MSRGLRTPPPRRAERKGPSAVSSPVPARLKPRIVEPADTPDPPPLDNEELPPIFAPLMAARADTRDIRGLLVDTPAGQTASHGPGAGGGVVAKELSVAGRSVVLLERGRPQGFVGTFRDELKVQGSSALGNAFGPDDRSPRVVQDSDGTTRTILPQDGGYGPVLSLPLLEEHRLQGGEGVTP